MANAQDRFYSFNNNVDNDYFTGNDGTIIGNVTYTTDRFGAPNAALNFGGAGASVNFGIMDSLKGATNFTIAGWFQKTPYGFQRAMFSNGSNLVAYADIGGNQINAYNSCVQPIGNAFVTIPTTTMFSSLPVGAWYHYALVMRNGWISAYINGKLYGTTNFNGPLCTGTFNFLLGEAPGISTNNNFSGGVDDLFILTRGLTSAEVDSIKNLPNPCHANIAITQQPSTVTITSDATVNFNCTSSNFGITYQWQVSYDGGKTFTDLTANSIYSNVNSSSLAVAATDTMNANQYRAKISDGTCTIFSNAGSLRYPKKVEWTMNNTMVSTTGTNPFTVVTQANNVGPTFEADRFGNPNSAFRIVNFQAYQNVTTSGLDFLSNTREFSFSGWYKVSNTGWLMYSAGAPNAVFRASNTAANAQQPILEISSGTNTPSLINGNISNNANTPTTWRHFVVSFKNGEANMYVNGVLVSKSICSYGRMPQAFSSFAITNTYISPNFFANGSFDDVMVCNWAISQNEVDSLYNAPNYCAAVIPITTQPANVVLQNAGTATFNVASSASGLTYQWQRSTDNGVTFSNIADDAVFSGTATATLSVNADTSFVLNKFRCLLNNGSTCVAFQSQAASLTVGKPIQEIQYSLNLGNLTNDFGTGYDGTLFGGGTSAVPNRFNVTGMALKLNSGAYINTGNIPFLNNAQNLTINAWFKKEPGNLNNKYYYSKDGDIFFAKTNLTGTLNNSSQTTILPAAQSVWQAIPDTAWFMHTTVFNNGVLDIFINGTKVATATSTNPSTAASNTPFIIGGKPTQIAPSPTPTYAIDDIYLTNSSWTASKVDSIYQATKACTLTWLQQPVEETLYTNGTITLNAIASGAATSYQWQISTDNGLSYANVINNATYSNATTNQLTINATPAIDQYLYRLVAFTPTCQLGSNSAKVNLTKDVAYNFNDQTPKNILGTNNQGSLSSGVIYSEDRFGNDSAAIRINGNNRFMTIGNLDFIDNATKFSYVGWYKKPVVPVANGEFFMVKVRDTWNNNQIPTAYLRAYISGNGIVATAGGGPGTIGTTNPETYNDINPGEWFQFSYIVDYPSFKIYLNGKQYGQTTLTTTLAGGMNPNNNSPYVPDGVIIGGYHNNGAASWSTDIDDIYISNRAFTVAQLDSLRALGNPCPGIVENVTNANNTLICDGATATLQIKNNGLIYNWYDAATSGTLLNTGITFTTPALNANATYFVEAIMPSCSTVNTRLPITVNVNAPVSTPTDITPSANLTLCPSQTANLLAAATAGTTITWWDAATAGNLIGTGASYTTGANAANTTYYIGGNNGSCTSTNRTAVNVVVDPNKTADLTLMPFSCPTNITGATYRWPLKVVSPGIVTVGSLTREAISDDTTTILIAPSTTYTVNVNDNGCTATATVTAPPFLPNFSLVSASTCQSCAIRNNRTYTFFDAISNQKLVTINDVNNSTSLGNIEVCLNVDPAFTVGATHYLGRSFHLTPDTNSNASLRLSFTNSEWTDLQTLAPAANLNSVHVVAFDGQQETPTSFNSFTNYGPFTAQLDAVGNYYIDVPVSGFSGFYITAFPAQPLSINELSASASIKNNMPNIQWQMVNNDDVAEYIVERSLENNNFVTIATVNTNSSNTYQYADYTATEGKIYYRIVARLKDGQNIVSNIVTVTLNNLQTATVAPNPSSGLVTITASDFKNCTVSDIYGRIVLESASKTLDLSHLANGQYNMVIRGKKTTTVTKIIKQ